MFLLLIRLSVLTLLIGGSVAEELTATCQQEIPAELIRNLWALTKQLIHSLPGSIGWVELQKVIDVYQRSVFSGEVIQKLLPINYNNLLFRLQHTLQRCVPSSTPSKWFDTIRKLERKIKKNRDKQTLKAVGEFTFILRWIDELAQHHVL